jgi:hypothetical protein
MKIPIAKYQFGQHVYVKVEEAGCPPEMQGWISAIILNAHGEIEYYVTDEDGVNWSSYSESWLSPVQLGDRSDPVVADGREFPSKLEAVLHCLWLIQRLCYFESHREGAPADGPRFREIVIESRRLLDNIGYHPGSCPVPLVEVMTEAGMRWHRLAEIKHGDETVELMAASSEEGIGVIARWVLRPDKTWYVQAIDTEGGKWQPVDKYEVDEGDCVPLIPPTVFDDRDHENHQLRAMLRQWIQPCFCVGASKCLMCQTRELLEKTGPSESPAIRYYY